jgi:NADPH-dependent curcumin reductase CurA
MLKECKHGTVRYKLHCDATWLTKLLKRGQTFDKGRMTAVPSKIWQLMMQGNTVGQLVEKIEAEYELGFHEARSVAYQHLELFSKKKLIKIDVPAK